MQINLELHRTHALSSLYEILVHLELLAIYIKWNLHKLASIQTKY